MNQNLKDFFNNVLGQFTSVDQMPEKPLQEALKIILPILKNTDTLISMHDICSIQNMTADIGYKFSMTIRYPDDVE